MIRTLVIDDEVKARETIIDMLNLFCKSVEVLGEASSVKTGYELINHHQPDLVLLDIKMSDGTGFDLLKKFEKLVDKLKDENKYQLRHYPMRLCPYQNQMHKVEMQELSPL